MIKAKKELTEKDLKGKIFLGIEVSAEEGLRIKFGDGTIAYFLCDRYIGEIKLDRIVERKQESYYNNIF